MSNKKILSVVLIGIFIGLAGLFYRLQLNDTEQSVIISSDMDGIEADFNMSLLDNHIGGSGSVNEYPPAYEDVVNKNSSEKALDSRPDIQKEAKESEAVFYNPKPKEEEAEFEYMIYVHICGQVNKPDVYEVTQGTRVYEVVKLAGGFTSHAASEFINQAEKTEDGQKIYIPSKKEVEGNSYYELTNRLESMSGDAGGEMESGSNHGQVNINTAGLDELMTLTGIGQAKAKSILSYREINGRFQTIDELKNIEGIKEGVFQKIRDFITTN